MNTLSEALARKTVDELKALAALLPQVARAGRKDELIAAILSHLDGEALRSLWQRLDEMQQLAVAESLYTPGGLFDSQLFRAKYGALPRFSVAAGDDKRSFGRRYEPPTPLCLFLYRDALQQSLPLDLGERLRRFVPEPAAASLRLTESLPDRVDDEPLTVRCTEREAIVDLPLLLRLADQGKLQVSDKTSQPGTTTLRLLADKLSGGDFYGPAAAPLQCEHEIGPIKAFAWPLLLQSAGLTQRSANKSALSPAGRKALSAAPADVLRAVWQKWLKSTLLDEFSRVDMIKGQKSKGRVMTAVAPRRATIAVALQDCPVGAWIAVDEFSRFMQAADLGFEVAHDPWKLYLSEPEHGSLGYEGSHTWDILQLRYLLCVLFEYAAVLGVIDVAFVNPESARQNFRDLWGADELAFLSRYDGLVYFRLTSLGAYCLGLSQTCSVAVTQPRAGLSVLPSLTVNVVRGSLAPEETLVLETWASPIGDTAWLLDRQKALAAVERGHAASELGEFLRSRDDQPLPETVEGFMRTTQELGKALRVVGPALLIECADSEIAARIAAHPETAGLCSLAGDRRLLVRAEHEDRFRLRVRVLGYGMSA
ncbi:MAG: hypothetical protein JHC40_12710 [Burkholderiales bacterium]|jgi:hypothetical protein|nr:hypothetical protein [Burkholderiales bacterium]